MEYGSQKYLVEISQKAHTKLLQIKEASGLSLKEIATEIIEEVADKVEVVEK